MCIAEYYMYFPKHGNSKAAIRVNQYFSVPVDPLVKLLICYGSIFDANFVGNNEARLRLSCNDQIPQVAVIRLDVALASAE